MTVVVAAAARDKNHVVPYGIFYNHSLVITAIIHLLDFFFPWNKTHMSQGYMPPILDAYS